MGNLGVLDKEGNLHLVGRLTDVIRSGGEKVMAVEVESC
jgi:non-ribosomal peptide synthetase component E (peptide arylation enzyme)